jgi:hypothetical protein
MTRVSSHQRGATLVVALIFLVLMSLFAVNAFHGASTNLRVVGNMQSRQESLAAAQVVIEQVISTTTFTINPAAVAATTYNVDIDNNATNDYAVRVSPQPTCYRVRILKNSELRPPVPGTPGVDDQCFFDTNGGNPLIEGGPSSDGTLANNSLCANTEWNIRTEVTDLRSGTQVAVNQGVGVRVPASDASTLCP